MGTARRHRRPPHHGRAGGRRLPPGRATAAGRVLAQSRHSRHRRTDQAYPGRVKMGDDLNGDRRRRRHPGDTAATRTAALTRCSGQGKLLP